MSDMTRNPLQIWSCKIGECPEARVPPGADAPMRDAVAHTYTRITGHEPMFIFSGWNADLTEGEREVVENRPRATPPTPRALTREQVEKDFLIQEIARLEAENDPAALRFTITRLEREIESLMTCQCEGCDDKLEEAAFCFPCMSKLQQQLATMTTERDGLREQMNAIAHTRTFEQSCQIIADLKQQLAVSQARCREMEQVEKQREEAGWVSRSYMDEALALKDKQLAQLQATLAAREARIAEMEALQTKLSHEWSKMRDERDAAVQEAARLREAVMWALGYCSFKPRDVGEGPYWWRKELRGRAFPDGVTEKQIAEYQQAHGHADAGKRS